MALKPYQLRVKNEKLDLDEKIIALDRFILFSDTFPKLNECEKALILEQKGVMRRYSEILENRIAFFEK